METQIKASLIALLDGITAADGPAVSREMQKLDGFVAADGPSLHPQLAHFLERRSYAKALQFLGGASDIPTGSCGGRPAKA
jgi:hypothetical protein